jgi:HlyD family secretion protein
MRVWPRGIGDWLDRKELQKDVLLSEKSEAAARLEQARRDRERGTLRSPVEGVVLHRHESNERVLPAGQLLVEIGRLADIEVEADVLSQDVVDVKAANPVDIYGPAIGAEPIRGKVARVYPAGFTKLSSLGVEQQRVKVVVAFDEGVLNSLAQGGKELGPDFRVRVRIYTATSRNAVVVPRNAVFKGESGGWRAFVVRGREAALTTVQLGVFNDDQVEILSGIQPDEHVILAPDADLEGGDRVSARLLEIDGPGLVSN